MIYCRLQNSKRTMACSKITLSKIFFAAILFSFFLQSNLVSAQATGIQSTTKTSTTDASAAEASATETSTNEQPSYSESTITSPPRKPSSEEVVKEIPLGTVNEGGGEKSIRVKHPNAAKGLIRIKKDGSYQYKVKIRPKTQSTSVNFSSISRPLITNTLAPTPITYTSMYGRTLYGLIANYEWLPFRSFGYLGLVLEGGISVSRGRGMLADGNISEEKYTLYTFPLGAYLKYRFEYAKRQWVVPYLIGGATYYALLESRDDGKVLSAGALAAGGGGGLQVNVSRMDPEGAFRLDREWGISDMWLNIELRVLQGLKQRIDFTNTTIQAGITLDY